jgi:hypothetical protein
LGALLLALGGVGAKDASFGGVWRWFGGRKDWVLQKKLFTLPDFVGYIAFASLLLHLVSSVIGLLCSRSFVKIYFSNPYEVRLRTNSLSG